MKDEFMQLAAKWCVAFNFWADGRSDAAEADAARDALECEVERMINAEREACARICDRHTASACAKEIRERNYA
jgi:hypothetical protein